MLGWRSRGCWEIDRRVVGIPSQNLDRIRWEYEFWLSVIQNNHSMTFSICCERCTFHVIGVLSNKIEGIILTR